MECSCGGLFSTTSEIASSEELLQKFPGQAAIIPSGHSKIYARHGSCDRCGRFGLSINPVEGCEQVEPKPKTKSIFSFVKREKQ